MINLRRGWASRDGFLQHYKIRYSQEFSRVIDILQFRGRNGKYVGVPKQTHAEIVSVLRIGIYLVESGR